MKIHFICRGNVLRSLIAETYLRSLNLPGVVATSSGTVADMDDPQEREFFAHTIAMLQRHGISSYAKAVSDRLTQKRVDGQDMTICMNDIVIHEAKTMVDLPSNTLNWSITDIGEGTRTDVTHREKYEEKIYEEVITQVAALAARLA